MSVLLGEKRNQMPGEDLVELKFRLYDGSDVGPFQYSPTATVAMLKERLVSEWPNGELIRDLLYQVLLIALYFCVRVGMLHPFLEQFLQLWLDRQKCRLVVIDRTVVLITCLYLPNISLETLG